MAKYTWPTPDRHSSAITSVRMRNEAKARISGLDNYATADTRDAALAELLATTSEVFNVKSYGAKGDDATDDTAAIQAAIDAAESVNVLAASEGSVVFLPAGNYRISSDIIIPEGVTVRGAGMAATRLRRHASASFTDAMVVMNDDTAVFAIALKLYDLQIHCSGLSPGLLARGLNEGCTIENVQVLSPLTFGFRIEPSLQPDTRITQNVYFGHMRVTSPVASTDGVVLESVRRCTFQSISVDTGATPGFEHGIRMVGAQSSANLFINTHLEDCERPILMGEDAPCQMNRFIGLHVTNPTQAPASQSFGGLTGSMAVVQSRSAGSQVVRNTIEGFSVNYDFDYDFVDAETGFNVPSTGSIERFNQRIEVVYDPSGNPHFAWDGEYDLHTLADEATPSIILGSLWTTGGTTTVTDFDDGFVGKTITILSAHAVTITDGTNILLNGSTNFDMAAGDTLTLTMFNDQVWEETSRKVNL